MAQTVESINQQIEQLTERKNRQIEQLKERKKAILQKEAKQNRKRRNHALMTAGGLVEACFENGWTEIDYSALARFIKEHGSALAACITENLEPKKAEQRLREWERRARGAASGGQDAGSGQSAKSAKTDETQEQKSDDLLKAIANAWNTADAIVSGAHGDKMWEILRVQMQNCGYNSAQIDDYINSQNATAARANLAGFYARREAELQA